MLKAATLTLATIVLAITVPESAFAISYEVDVRGTITSAHIGSNFGHYQFATGDDIFLDFSYDVQCQTQVCVSAFSSNGHQIRTLNKLNDTTFAFVVLSNNPDLYSQPLLYDIDTAGSVRTQDKYHAITSLNDSVDTIIRRSTGEDFFSIINFTAFLNISGPSGDPRLDIKFPLTLDLSNSGCTADNVVCGTGGFTYSEVFYRYYDDEGNFLGATPYALSEYSGSFSPRLISTYVDGSLVASVPEPNTWMYLVFGFGIAGLKSRKSFVKFGFRGD